MTETSEVFSMILTGLWDDDVKKIVGEITIAFAQLEHVLWLLPKRLDKKMTLQEWAAIADTLKIPRRCQQIRDYYGRRHMNQEPEAKLDVLLGEVEELNEKRHSVVHARWGCKKAYSRGPIVSTHRIWKDEDKGVNLAELTALARRVQHIRDELLHFVPANASLSASH